MSGNAPRSDGVSSARELWLHDELSTEDFERVLEVRQGAATPALPAFETSYDYDEEVGRIWQLQGAGKLEEAKQRIALHGLERFFPEFE